MRTYIVKLVYHDETDSPESTVVSRINAAVFFADAGEGRVCQMKPIGILEKEENK